SVADDLLMRSPYQRRQVPAMTRLLTRGPKSVPSIGPRVLASVVGGSVPDPPPMGQAPWGPPPNEGPATLRSSPGSASPKPGSNFGPRVLLRGVGDDDGGRAIEVDGALEELRDVERGDRLFLLGRLHAVGDHRLAERAAARERVGAGV